jgi:rifampicin phosphotransferase
VKTRSALALLATLASHSACSSMQCELDPGDDPVAVRRLGCESDREVMSTGRDDSVFAHTRTTLVIVDREDGDQVYFIDPDKYTLHYYFARDFLNDADKTPVGTLAEFNILNYRRPNRRFLLGKLVEYVDQDVYTFELAAGDNADADMIVDGFRTVAAKTDLADVLRYRPVSADQEELLPEIGRRIRTIATDDVFSNQIYQPLNPGVGYGTLRFRQTATLEGQPLSPTDLVVLDRVPNDLSMVAGIITAEFQTPLAHVGVLAKTRGTPNMALRDAWTNDRLRPFEGQLVRLEVTPQDFTVEIADPADAQAYWQSLRPTAPQVPQHDSVTTPLFDVTRVTLTEVVRIGAKASNLGELYRIQTADFRPLPLPDKPFAIPFAHYAQHLTAAGVFPMIDALIADYQAGRLAPAELERRLFAIRWTIYRAPVAPALLDNVIALAGTRWPADQKLRVRSSTNVEDLANFTGAGLYTSAGMRVSDGREAMANAIKTVWASVWNSQAFIERDFYRVDQHEVRMGLLVHPAQDGELANGVALTINEFSELRPAHYINSQIGEVSVTNPTGDAVPEQILFYTWYEEPEYEVISRSSLLGWTTDWPTENAILTDAELADLSSYLEAIHTRYRTLYPGHAVDAEWKLMPGRQLLIKQARPFLRRDVAE